MELQAFVTRAELFGALAEWTSAHLRRRLLDSGGALLAVPGGTTPGPYLKLLGAVALDWARITITLTDERCVPLASPLRNERMLREALAGSRAQGATIEPLLDDAGQRRAIPVAPADVVVLGMGLDGHAASLFPGDAGLEQSLGAREPGLVDARAPDGTPRISRNHAALKAPGATAILLTGDDKRAALERARAADARSMPIRWWLEPGRAHVFWAP